MGDLRCATAVNAIFVARYAQPQTRVVIDKQTGQELTLVTKDNLFWIRVKYWTYIILAYGVVGTLSEWRK